MTFAKFTGLLRRVIALTFALKAAIFFTSDACMHAADHNAQKLHALAGGRQVRFVAVDGQLQITFQISTATLIACSADRLLRHRIRMSSA